MAEDNNCPEPPTQSLHGGDEHDNYDDDDPFDVSSMSEEEGGQTEPIVGQHSNNNNHRNNSSSSNNNNNNTKPRSNTNSSSSLPLVPPLGPHGSLSSLNSGGVYHLTTVDSYKPPPSPGGSMVSATSTVSAANSQSLAQAPRFYDSEDDGGGGSLIFVADSQSLASGQPLLSASSQSPNPMQGKQLRLPNAATNHDAKSSKMKQSNTANGQGDNASDPPLLPYPQRRKLKQNQTDTPPVPPSSGGNGETSSTSPKANEKKSPAPPPPRPPVPPKPSLSRGGSGSNLQAQVLAEKYKIPQIPPFRNQDSDSDRNQSDAESDNENPRRLGKTDNSGGGQGPIKLPPPLPRKAISSSSYPEKPMERERPPLAQSSSTSKQLRPPQSAQEVICPPAPSTGPPESPRSSGYHVRVQSQGSVSSLGSNAGGDSTYGEHYSQDPPLDVIGMQQPAYSQMSPSNYHYGQMQQQHQRPPPRAPPPNAPSVNYNDVLGQDIATFLHGERIAAAATTTISPHPGEYHHPSHWNPPYGPKRGGEHPHKSYRGFSPPIRPEPLPPPLTAVPNMTLHRARLPSISDDDWEEKLERLGANKKNGLEEEEEEEEEDEEEEEEDSEKNEWITNNQFSSMDYYGQNQMIDGYYGQHPHYLEQPGEHNYPGNNYFEEIRDKRQISAHNHYQYPHQPYLDHELSDSDIPHSAQGRYTNMSDHNPHEQTSLLSATGIHTYESRNGDHAWYARTDGRSDEQGYTGHPQITPSGSRENLRRNGSPRSHEKDDRRRKKKKSKRRREKEKRAARSVYSSGSSQEDESVKRKHGKSKRSKGKRRNRKARSDSITDDNISENYPESLFYSNSADKQAPKVPGNCIEHMFVSIKLLICNLPLSAAAISYSVVLLGIVWLKWIEEILSSCEEVELPSSQCAFSEFPGCYSCDEANHIYRLATGFHNLCSYVAGASATCFFLKAMLCWKVFIDEMSSPVTASPAGLVFMTITLAFSGRGDSGKVLVLLGTFLHIIVAMWFIYMSLAYQTKPDPSWFPNTVGIALCSVKVWFYYPTAAYFLIAIASALTFLYFPISLVRVAANRKMSASICWIQMICPAVSLYSLAVIMQPPLIENETDTSDFQNIQQSIYLPSMHILFVLCCIGLLSSLHGIIVRWSQISKEEFSPAHAAYSFPLLTHAIAIQAYRSALDFFAGAGVTSSFKSFLHLYWVILVISGSFIALVCITTYLVLLPSWTTDIDTKSETEPPAPDETLMYDSVMYGETIIQPYICPPVLQANETGILMLIQCWESNTSKLVRTRKVPALGFEPRIRMRRLLRERDILFDYISKASRLRDTTRKERDREDYPDP